MTTEKLRATTPAPATAPAPALGGPRDTSGDADLRNGITRLAMSFYARARRLHLAGRPGRALAVAAMGRVVTSIEISPEADVHPSLGIYHGQGLVIGAGAVVGPDCVLCHGVTLGNKDGGYPTLGRGVAVWPGAQVMGAITIGDGAVVGANAVVLHDVAPGDVVAGVPARSILTAPPA